NHHPTPPHELPTYPFQHHRYWLNTPKPTTNTTHPLLNATLELANRDELLLTGRISLSEHTWLAEHVIAETALLPATAFMELVVHAGDQVGCRHIDELTLHTPLPLPSTADVQLQLTVQAADADGRRALSIHARPTGTAEVDGAWTHHADALLSPHSPAPSPDTATLPWPPPDATPLDLTDAYDNLATIGYAYGPTFQGLTHAWKHDDDLYAEVTLPASPDTTHIPYAIHPALLDAALHPLILDHTDPHTVRLPYIWTNVALHRTQPTTLRVRWTKQTTTTVDGGVYHLTATDPHDNLVATSTVSLRTAPLRAVTAHGTQDSLYETTWQRVPAQQPAEGLTVHTVAPDTNIDALLELPRSDSGLPDVVAVFCDAPANEGDEDIVARSHAVTRHVLDLLQRWLADDRLDQTRLAFITHGSTTENLATAPLWGLIRTAQSEHPGRFLLIDTDHVCDPGDTDLVTTAIATALHTDETHLALRKGNWHAPRLVRVLRNEKQSGISDGETPAFDPEGTVLITGATGALGTLFAHHLVTQHGVR
ncbi:polyketide synthase dehydratase domain-containing protein, partial [Streptomyces sp. NPDC007983]|uniref:polyketide synthase dehydratase domain-containing protein n=1 Tax=Streptomyces sp. NPDC007983 TaxID=3364800 RepID=UPI0036E0DD5D